MPTKVPEDRRWLELACTIEGLSGRVQASVDPGGRESERVCGLEPTTRSMQEAVQNLAQRQGAGASSPTDFFGFNSFVDKNVEPDGLASKTGLKQCSRRYSVWQDPNVNQAMLSWSGTDSGGEQTYHRP